MEFSANSRYLYTLCGFCGGKLSQFDTEAGDAAAIAASQHIWNSAFGAMQLAPDGKIYISQNFGSYLNVINNPNSAASAAGFTTNAVYLGGRFNRVGGLPSFVSSYFDPADEQIEGDTVICQGIDTALYRLGLSSCADSISWTYRGAGQILAQQDDWIQIAFGLPARLDTLIAFRFSECGRITDTMHIQILANQLTPINLGADQALCGNSNLSLGPLSGFTSYRWSDASTANSLTVSQAGTYWVKATDINGCQQTDSLTVLADLQATPLELGADSCLCDGNVRTLDAGSGFQSYLWQDGSFGQYFTAYLPGTYHVAVTDVCGNIARDTISLGSCNAPTTLSLGPDTLLASLDSLDAGNVGCQFRWSTGDTTRKIEVNQSGTYSVWVNCGGCEAVDDVYLYDVVLDADLLHFEGKKRGDDFQIYWEVRMPTAWRYFILDASHDLNHFEAVGEFAGGKTFYESEILDIRKKTYFRLRMIDHIGNEKLSSVLEIFPAASSTWRIVPNPSTSEFFIQTNSQEDILFVHLLSLQAEILQVWSVSSQDRKWQFFPKELPSGVYFVEIQLTTGERVVRKWIRK